MHEAIRLDRSQSLSADGHAQTRPAILYTSLIGHSFSDEGMEPIMHELPEFFRRLRHDGLSPTGFHTYCSSSGGASGRLISTGFLLHTTACLTESFSGS
jgi:hypothetical protein